MTNSSFHAFLRAPSDVGTFGGKSENRNDALTKDVGAAPRALLLHRVVFLPMDSSRQNITAEESATRNRRRT